MTTATPRRTAPGHLLDLPGQTFVAEGPLDLNGMYMAHHAFRRDLARFAAAARNTPVEAVDVWRALAVRWERFSDILHHHHTTEDDVLWPQLLDLVDASGDTEGRATLEAMEAEHELIDPLLRSCADGVAAMARTPSTETRDRLAAATAATVESLSHHLRHEETGALPLVQSLLSAEGWDRVEQAAGSGMTPRKLFFLVPWAADGLSTEQLETVLSTMGGPFRVVLRLARGSYQRRERVAFRFA